MAGIPRYRAQSGFVVLSAGFRPFFLAASLWAALAMPLWLIAYAGSGAMPSAMPAVIWHVHEMVFGYAAAAVAGFLLTAIPNWTGRLPLQGAPLAVLVALWLIGRLGVLFSAAIGAPLAAVADLAFPTAFLAVVAREIFAGRNWRNLPMLLALSLLLIGNLLVHLEVLNIAETAMLGNRIGLLTLFLLISLVGGRIIPSFTRNWLVKNRAEIAPPAPEPPLAFVVLAITALALAASAARPDATITAWATLIAGMAAALRLWRWRGYATAREPLLFILHIGYFWIVLGLLLLGINGIFDFLPATAALHVLTVGGVGTMTLAVMTRASLGHTGRPLVAGPGTNTIYVLVTFAALLRVLAPLAGDAMLTILDLAGAAWTLAFGLFALLYGAALAQPRVAADAARPI